MSRVVPVDIRREETFTNIYGNSLGTYPRDSDVHPVVFCFEDLQNRARSDAFRGRKSAVNINFNTEQQAFVLKRPNVLFGKDSRLFNTSRRVTAAAHKEKLRSISKALNFIGTATLYVLLGYTAATMVQFHEEFQGWNVKGIDECFTSFQNISTLPQTCFEKIKVFKVLPPTDYEFTNTTMFSTSCTDTEGSTTYYVPLVDETTCMCVKPEDLPKKLYIYLAAGIFTFCNLGMSFAEFFATKYDKDYAATMFSVYGAIQYLVNFAIRKKQESLTSSMAFHGKNSRLPELRPIPRDDVMVTAGLLCVITVGVGNWLIAKNSVTAGLYVVVTGSLGLANAILQFVQSARDIDLATLTVVSQITDWAAHNQCLDDHEGVEEIKRKLDLLKDDMDLVETEEKQIEMYNPQAPIADQIDELLQKGSAAQNISRGDMVFGGRRHGLEDKFSVIVIGTSDLRTRARGVMETANIMKHKRKMKSLSTLFQKSGTVLGYLLLGGMAATVAELQENAEYQGDCITQGMLPSVNNVYAAAGVLTFCKIMQSLCEFFGTQADDLMIRSKIDSAWDAVFSVFTKKDIYAKNDPFGHHQKDHFSLTPLRDDARIMQGIFCLCMLALGYYAIFQKYFVAGLGLCVVFSFALANSIQGFVSSNKGLNYAKMIFVRRVADWASEWVKHPDSLEQISRAKRLLNKAGAFMSIEEELFEVAF